MVKAPVSRLIPTTLDLMVLMTRCSLSSSSLSPNKEAVLSCSGVGAPSEKARRQEKSSILGFWTSGGNFELGHSVVTRHSEPREFSAR